MVLTSLPCRRILNLIYELKPILSRNIITRKIDHEKSGKIMWTDVFLYSFDLLAHVLRAEFFSSVGYSCNDILLNLSQISYILPFEVIHNLLHQRKMGGVDRCELGVFR